MAFVKHRKPVRTLWVLLFFWILSGCAYQNPPLQQAIEEPPPVEINTETLIQEPEMPVETKPDINIIAPEKPALNPPVSIPSTSGFYTHKVRWEEETLSHIAQWYTGTVKNWKAIAKANPELDPKKLDTGDTIFIPENLLISRKPMPFSFLRPTVHKKARPTASPKKKAIPSDAPKLFGPIDTESPPIESDTAELFGPME